RALYGAKRAALVDGLAPLAARGWRWPGNPAGLHLAVGHRRAATVRAVAETSGLELALVGSYRAEPADGDGLFLRFGGLPVDEVRAGAAALVRAARRSRP